MENQHEKRFWNLFNCSPYRPGIQILFRVLRTAILDSKGVKNLQPLLEHSEYDFWMEPRLGRAADIMTSSENVAELWDELTRLGLRPTVFVSDVA
ncbi:hypothetical protein B566_EDAN011980, partial [Ephemera danica]